MSHGDGGYDRDTEKGYDDEDVEGPKEGEFVGEEM